MNFIVCNKKLKYLTLYCLILVCSCNSNNNVENKSLQGIPMPSFSFKTKIKLFETKEIDQSKQTVFFFFSPSCPYCRSMIQDIKNNIHDFLKVDFYLLTNVDYTKLNTITPLINADQYKNIIIGQDYKNFFAKHFKIKGVPYLQIYGNNGRLKTVFEGVISIDKLKEAIKN